MKIQVTPHTIQIIRDTDINAGEYNVSKCTFEFSNEYQELSNVAVFTNCEGTCVEQAITNNECIIPYEMLENPGQVKLGVYGYEVEEETLVLRYSPTAQYFNVKNGSYAEGEQPTPPSPSIVEQLQAQITDNRNDINDLQEDVSNLEQTKADKSEIPTKVSQLDNDSGYIDKNVDDLTNYTPTNELSAVATSGSYNDLEDKPDLSVYSLITETGSKIDLEINSTTYVLNAKLYDKNNNLISTSSGIDLPLESMVVGATYDSVNKQIVLTLQNGQTLNVPVGDLVAGLQSEITSENMLSSDLVDDTNHTHKFITTQERESWNNKSDFSGSYNDLTNKPDLSVYEEKSNKVTSIDENSTNTQYPSAKCVYDSQEEQDYQIERANMIYNALPKVTGEGESVTLEDTAECPMETELGSTKLSQYTTTGKNLLDNTLTTTTSGGITVTKNDDKTLTINGTATTNVSFLINSGVTLSVGTYYFSGLEGVTSDQAYINFSGIVNVFDGEVSSTLSEEKTAEVRLYIRNGASFTNKVVKPMISTTGGEYEPYTNGVSPNPDYPQEIHSISGDNEIKVVNKNLFDKSTTNTGKSIASDGSLQNNGSMSVSDYIKVNQNTDYYLSNVAGSSYARTIAYYNSSKTFISYESITSSSDKTSGKITTPTNTNYIRVCYTTIYEDSVQVEKGSQATSYEPHQEQTYPITLGDLEYCKIGNYEDEFFKAIEGDSIYDSLDSTTKASLTSGMWYLQKNIGKVVYEGTTIIDVPLSGITYKGLYKAKYPSNKINTQGITAPKAYFDRAKFASISSEKAENTFYDNPTNYVIIGSTTDTLETLQSKFNGGSMYYVLETPTYILLNNTLQTELNNIEKAISYQGQTNVSQINNDLPFTLSLSAIRDLSNIFELIENQ